MHYFRHVLSNLFRREFVHLVICFHLFFNAPNGVLAKSGNGHSSISLYQGARKFELDAKDCPVGVAFNQPEYFSCACITGIWAFYNNPCHSPIAIIGGDHHCFQMPSQPITVAMIVSNPLKGLGETLTAFDGDMEAIRSKTYRNLHTNLNDADRFVSLNSSWTLVSPDKSKAICLENQNVMFAGLSADEAEMFPGMSYCSFVDVSQELPFIGSVKKGCNSSMVMEPLECQPVLPPTDETNVCLNEQLIAEYIERVNAPPNLDPLAEIEEEADSASETGPRLSRALQSLGRFAGKRELAPEESKTEQQAPEAAPKFASAYYGEPEWHQRWAASKGADYFQQMNNTEAASPATEKIEEINVDTLWKNPSLFFSTIPGKETSIDGENPLMTNHLWIHYRYAIRNVLNITRLVPPDEEMIVRVKTGRIKKLLRMHSDIMKKICPLAPSSFYETVIGVFTSVLTKGFRWKEPYLEQTNYLRILTSLTTCKNSAQLMTFVPKDTKQCMVKGAASYVTLPDKDRAGTVNVRLEIPEVFQSEMFEPIIEAVWKTFVSVHSYCYKDFSDQYQDHHRYTTLMMGLFSNQLHDIWVRNKSLVLEYSGILGQLKETIKSLDSCAMGARMISDYPYHLNRPSKMSKYFEDDEINSNTNRRKRNTAAKDGVPSQNDFLKEDETSYLGSSSSISSPSDVPHSRKKRLAVNVVNKENVAERSIFDDKGVCLRRYGETRSIAGSHCNQEKANKV